MANKRHKHLKILYNLRHVDVLVGQWASRVHAICEVRTTEQTCYRWRRQRACSTKPLPSQPKP